jgi:carboxyl-terminal processing protease
VQSLLDLGSQLDRSANPPKLGALKITMQQFYRPNGASTQKQGVLADLVLPSLTSHMDVAESDLDYAMEFDKVGSSLKDDDRYSMVTEELLENLRRRSLERQAIQRFQKLSKNVGATGAEEPRSGDPERQVPGERQEMDAEKKRKEAAGTIRDGHPVFDRESYYNGEVWRSPPIIWSSCAETVAQMNRAKTGREGS